jgi:hypothetical protein
MGSGLAGRGGAFCVSVILAGMLLCPGWAKEGIARADQKAEVPAPREESTANVSAEAVEHHTALAGEPLHRVPWWTSPPVTAATRRP